MIAGILLSTKQVGKILKALGYTKTRKKFSGKTGVHSIWETPWGHKFMVPEGLDGACPHWVLSDIIDAVANTKPTRKTTKKPAK